MLKKTEVVDNVLSDNTVQVLSAQIDQKSGPGTGSAIAGTVIDDIEKSMGGLNTTQGYILNLVLDALRGELLRLENTEGTTKAGKVIRALLGFKFGQALKILQNKL